MWHAFSLKFLVPRVALWTKKSSGYETLLNYLRNGQSLELYRRLHADMFNSDKILINVVDMNIKLTRAPETFYRLSPSDDTKGRIKILETILLTCQRLIFR